MRHRYTFGTPAFAAFSWLSLLALGPLACAKGGDDSGKGEPPAVEAEQPFVETFDEDFETVPVQQRLTSPLKQRASAGGGSGGAAGSGGGAGMAGAAGTAGTAGKGGSAGAAGQAGSAGSAGSGGGKAGGGGQAGSAGQAGSGGGMAGQAGSGGGQAGSAGAGGQAGSAGGGGSGEFLPSALWQFDDCSSKTDLLLDSSGNDLHAARTAGVGCAEGISGQGIAFDAPGDRVDVENAPQFALDKSLAVSAWVNPEKTDGNRPVVLKRLENQTAFSLRVQNGQVQFSVVLDTGKTVTSAAPIAANEWSHVAGLYDGRFVFLFLNGEQVGQVFAEGSLRDVEAPLRVGATTQTQRFVGRIDEVLVSTGPAAPADMLPLSCIGRPGTLSVDPASSGPVPAGSVVSYDVTVRNGNVGFCAPDAYLVVEPFGAPPGFESFAGDSAFDVAAGESRRFSLVVVSAEDVEPQIVTLPFGVINLDHFEELVGQVSYEVAP